MTRAPKTPSVLDTVRYPEGTDDAPDPKLFAAIRRFFSGDPKR
jgi:hypothetical protein